MVGVSAMSPRSTEPPVSAAMTGGPPMKLVQLTVYGAPLSASVAAKTVWYSLSWSPNVMVTPLSDVVLADLTDAALTVAVAPTVRPARSARAVT